MGRPREFDEEEVLDEAMELFWAHGFEGTSLGDLEEALGVGRQSLYNAFGDKKSLFLATLDRYRARSRGMLEELASGREGLEGIRRYLHALVDFLAPVGPRRGCMVTRSAVDLAREVPEVASRVLANTREMQDALSTALAVAVGRGEVDPDLPVEATARLLASHVYGMGVLASGTATREELGELVETMLARL